MLKNQKLNVNCAQNKAADRCVILSAAELAEGSCAASTLQNICVAILNGLGKVGGGDGLRTVQIGDGACHPQDAVVGAGGETHAGKGGRQKVFTGGVQRTDCGDHGGGHIGVAGDGGAGKAALLENTGGVYAGLDRCRRFGGFSAAHGFEFHGGDGYVEVDAVQQRTGDLFCVFFRLACRAGAAAAGMSSPAAPAGVHGAYQLKAGRHVQRAAGTGHGDFTVLQRLTHGLQNIPMEFRKLVEEEHAVVRKGDLAGAQGRAAAGEGGSRSGVVRTAEGTAGQQGIFGVGHACHGPNGGNGQRFVAAHVGQNGGQPLCQHALACARGADKRYVV